MNGAIKQKPVKITIFTWDFPRLNFVVEDVINGMVLKAGAWDCMYCTKKEAIQECKECLLADWRPGTASARCDHKRKMTPYDFRPVF